MALPAKEPEKKLLLSALEDLKPEIEALERKGYSRAEVVDLLVKQGIPVKLYHIKNLFLKPRGAAAGETGQETETK